MEKTRKFRNHISIVAEQLGSGFFALAAVLVGILLQNAEELARVEVSFSDLGKGFLILPGILVLLGIWVGRAVWTWSKTWISIQEQAIVVEKNTLQKKSNTIGIKNISNINLEQNLFEMLLGTSKVKIDTNSFSTADKTDVKIVLKKSEAEAFRAEVTAMLQKISGDLEVVQDEEEQEHLKEEFDFVADGKDVALHGLYSISVFSVLILLAGIVGVAGVIMRFVKEPGMVESLLGAAASILVAFSFLTSAAWDILRGFVQYYDFRVKRRKDKLYIRYGLMKKVEYTIPVDKIQALKLKQSFVARIAGKYMAEIVNVGIGDEKGEQKSFLVLYGNRQEVQEKLELLLPEFAGIAKQDYQKQPAGTWGAWMLPFVIYELTVLLAGVFCVRLLQSYQIWICAAVIGLTVAGILLMVLEYLTAGMALDENFIKIVKGYFGRTAISIRYEKIQYMETKQSFLAKACGVQKGELHLLASSINTQQELPYFRAGLEEEIKQRML